MLDSSAIETEDMDRICDALALEFSSCSGKTVSITGGAGFLGFYLVQSLLHWNRQNSAKSGIQVNVFDTFIRGRPAWLDACAKQAHCELYTHDVTETLPPQLCQSDFIIHAASIASPIFYREYPIETMDANVHGLRQILDLSRVRAADNNPISAILFFSTSEIYGDPDADNIPTSESYRGNVSCTGPRACYDESKRYGETLCVNFANQHQVPVKTARPFNNYGPGLSISDKRAPPDFANDVLSNRDIVLLSDGSPTRTFCYISDAITGYFKILFNGRKGEAYNIGNESPEISVREFAEKNVAAAKELFGYEGSVKFAKSDDEHYLTDNPNRRCPNIAKARAELNFEPVVPIDEGIRRSLIWYQDNRET